MAERYLISGTSGTSGNWRYESLDWIARSLDISSEGIPGILSYSGSFMNYTLNLAEKQDGFWRAEAVQGGIQLPGDDFAYAADDVPFVAYIYRYWEPETTVELRYARRVDGEWLYGVIDDAGGPGGEVSGGTSAVIMRVDSEGNPAVAYRVTEYPRHELRLARWNAHAEGWEIQVVRDNCGSDFNFAFDPQGRACFVYGGDGSTEETEAIHYLRQDDVWEDEIVEEWPAVEVYLHSFKLAYDPLGHPLIASYFYAGEPRIRVWWHSGSAWETAAEFSNAYVCAGITGWSLNLLLATDGTPHITYCRFDNWDDGPKEVVLVNYD